MSIQLGVLRPAGDDRALDCPHCGPNDTPLMHLEPSMELVGATIHLDYRCDLCGRVSCLNLVHSKGQTLLFWTTN